MSPDARPDFPAFDPIRVRIPLRSRDYTVYPDPPETWREWLLGFPLELHPFAWDYLWIGARPEELRLWPHYRESTWDRFSVDPSGHVRVQALCGLFPFTLGKQPELIAGLRATLQALPERVHARRPDIANKLEQIEQQLELVEKLLIARRDEFAQQAKELQRRERETIRGRLGQRFWARKLRRSRRAAPGRPD